MVDLILVIQQRNELVQIVIIGRHTDSFSVNTFRVGRRWVDWIDEYVVTIWFTDFTSAQLVQSVQFGDTFAVR